MSHFKVQQKRSLATILVENLGLLDFYGTPINLQIKKQEKYVSPFGLGISVFVVIVCSILLCQNLNDAVDRKNPIVINQQQILQDTPPFPLLKNNFTLVTTLVDINSMSSIPNRESLYRIEYRYCVRNRQLLENGKVNVTQNCTSLASEPCDPEKHFHNSIQKEYFKKFQLQNMICLNSTLWDENKVELQGFANSERWAYITVKTTVCQNTTDFQGCAPQEVINKTLSKGYYVNYLFDNLIDQLNPVNPYELFTKLWYTTFSVGYSKTIVTSYSITSTITDEGLFIEDLDEKTTLIYSSDTQFQDLPNPNFLINQQIMLDNKKMITIRNYQKIQEVFGNIGGLYNILYYGLFIFITPIIQMMMNLSIIDKIFTFEIEGEQQENKDLKKKNQSEQRSSIFSNFYKSKQSLHIIRSQSVLSASKRKKSQYFDREQLVKKFVEQRQGSLNFGFFAIFGLLCGRKKTEKAQIQYAIDKIYQKLDVMYILNKLFEIEKLKSIVFDEQQLKLFNCMPKPMIPTYFFNNNHTIQEELEQKLKIIEQQPQFQPILAEEKTELKKTLEAMEAYKIIAMKEIKTPFDNRVIQFLDEDMQELFDIFTQEETQRKLESIRKIYIFIAHFPNISAQNRESYNDVCERELQEQQDQLQLQVPSSFVRTGR